MSIHVDYVLVADYITVDLSGNPVVGGILDEVHVVFGRSDVKTVPFVFSALAHLSGVTVGDVSIPSYWELGVKRSHLLTTSLRSLVRPATPRGLGYVFVRNAVLSLSRSHHGREIMVGVTVANERTAVTMPIFIEQGGQ